MLCDAWTVVMLCDAITCEPITDKDRTPSPLHQLHAVDYCTGGILGMPVLCIIIIIFIKQ